MERNYCIHKVLQAATSLLFSFALMSCGGVLLQPGDLLFHVSAESNAITSVTEGMIDHVAIVLNSDSVIEAVRRGVVTTPIDSLRKQKGHYLQARIKRSGKEKADIATTLANARGYLGYAYDQLYLPDNKEIYCSELVQLSFVSQEGTRLFSPVPMSFHDASGEITSYWKAFYAKHQMDVPEGKPGTNPNELIRRDNIRIIGKLK